MPDLPSPEDVKKMKVADLKQALEDAGLDSKGLKAELSERLLKHIEGSSSKGASGDTAEGSKTPTGSEKQQGDSCDTSIASRVATVDAASVQDEPVRSDDDGGENGGEAPSTSTLPTPPASSTDKKQSSPSRSSARREEKKKDDEEEVASSSKPSSAAPASPAKKGSESPSKKKEKEAVAPASTPTSAPSSSSSTSSSPPKAAKPATAPAVVNKEEELKKALKGKMGPPAAASSAGSKKGPGGILGAAAASAAASRESSNSGTSSSAAGGGAVAATAATAEPVPPAVNPVNCTIRVDGFIRPFRQPAAKELVEAKGGGPLVEGGFWMDLIKTHCYATFEKEECAVRAREALYNLVWPERGGKLRADFSNRTAAEVNDETNAAKVARANSRSLNGGIGVGGGGAVGVGPRAAAPTSSSLPPLRKPDSTSSLNGSSSSNVMDVDGKLARRKRELGPSPDRAKRPKLEGEESGEGGASGAAGGARGGVPLPSLDDLFRSTKTKPKLYWLPLNEEVVTVKREKLQELKAKEKEAKKAGRDSGSSRR